MTLTILYAFLKLAKTSYHCTNVRKVSVLSPELARRVRSASQSDPGDALAILIGRRSVASGRRSQTFSPSATQER